MKKNKYLKALSENLLLADEKAGYPPNCNEGYVAKDGKCVPAPKEKDEATHDGRMKGYHGPASYSDLWEKVNKKN